MTGTWASPMVRLLRKVDFTETCWLWTGGTTRGYGQLRVGTRMEYVHRWFYQQIRGPIPASAQIDHLCRRPLCIRPSHLEPVTQQENIRRGLVGEHNRVKTHCPQGHEYTVENTYVYRNGRSCRECGRQKNRRQRQQRHLDAQMAI